MNLKTLLFRKERRIGSAKNKRQYDLPLNKSAGGGFLILLIALMTFLVILALAGSLTLSTVAGRWSGGLENRATIEIPAEKSDGEPRSPEQISKFTAEVAVLLSNDPNVADFDVMDKNDIAELVAPWLGTDMVLDEIPLPGLISLHLKNASPEVIEKMVRDLALINDNIRIDTHEAWLSHLLKITGTLQFAGLFIILVMAATTAAAIAGGVRSRMAIHRADIELLHLMGASDEYITRQFQRQALIFASRGSIAGALAALLILAAVGLAQFSDIAPDALAGYLSIKNLSVLVLTPLLACFISFLTARATVLRELARMP